MTNSDALIASMTEYFKDNPHMQDMCAFITNAYQSFSPGDQSRVDIAIGPNATPTDDDYSQMFDVFTAIRPSLGRREMTAEELISVLNIS